jgi:hypothetical protein
MRTLSPRNDLGHRAFLSLTISIFLQFIQPAMTVTSKRRSKFTTRLTPVRELPFLTPESEACADDALMAFLRISELEFAARDGEAYGD